MYTLYPFEMTNVCHKYIYYLFLIKSSKNAKKNIFSKNPKKRFQKRSIELDFFLQKIICDYVVAVA